MIDLDRLLALVRALNREGVDYVVVGAVALGLHGLARATRDLDLFVRPTPDNVVRLKCALSAVWSDPDIETTTLMLEGEPVQAATPRMLYVMKRDTLRPLDQADAAALRRTFDLEGE